MKLSVKIVFGVIIMALGVVLLLGSLGIFDAGDIIANYWPVIIILFGVYNLLDKDSPAFFGIILILLGAYLQMRVLDYDLIGDVSISSLLFPIIIIIIGLRILLPSKS